ncbi:MAG: chorismate pyruvate-lyase family protein [Candidatus Latescibacterota bacterium]
MSAAATSEEFSRVMMDDLFVAQDSRPAHVQPVTLGSLAPFDRGLLVIVGLVTQFIEASCLEPVAVIKLSQVRERLDVADPWLHAASGDSIVRRRVILKGEQSDRTYAIGEAVIAPGRLPASLEERLDTGDEGIGRLLRRTRVESHGELLWYGQAVSDLPPELDDLGDRTWLTRTYRLLRGGEPMMTISEWFPMTACGDDRR